MPSAIKEQEATKPGPGPGRSPGSLAVLREHAIKPGEVRNKQGVNRWVKAQLRFRSFAMETVDDDGHTRDDNVLDAIYRSALIEGPRGAADRTLWQEHMRGKAPRVPNDIEWAEHLRGVEGDRIRAVIATLGPKLRTLSPTELRDYFEACSNGLDKFVVKAKEQQQGIEPGGQTEEQAQLPETEDKP